MIARISIALLMFLPWFAHGQSEALVEAYRSYQGGDLAKAKELVDKAVMSETHARDPEAWLLKGFICKDLYKAKASDPQAETLRQEALESLHNSILYDEKAEFYENAKQAYDFLTRSYYNDAARALNAMDGEAAIQAFEAYTDHVLKLDTTADLRTRRVEFNNALGTVYAKEFNSDRTREGSFDKAVRAFQRVLELDPENYGANYNLATLYYNRGVFKIRGIGADDDIPTIQQIQEVGREFFQLALPYMLKAHDMNPNRRETLIGLEGIYYSLQDQENSDRYRMLFEELPPQEPDR